MVKQTVWQRLDGWARALTPFGLAALILLVSLVPTHIPEFGRIGPPLLLIAVYHWAVYRPDLLPAVAVFGLGLAHDILSGGPVGLYALVLVTVHGMVTWQRRFLYGKSFGVAWLGFAVVGCGAALMAWLVSSIYFVAVLDPRAFLFQFLVTLALYPLLAWLFLRWQRAFLREEA